mmetsp:Transcript_122199/g.340625  ORF Transcript_122199/g.340625 Transcript_122199/m.340625 type:complete len:230 (+) Transcript_122199:365-1054(+)
MLPIRCFTSTTTVSSGCTVAPPAALEAPSRGRSTRPSTNPVSRKYASRFPGPSSGGGPLLLLLPPSCSSRGRGSLRVGGSTRASASAGPASGIASETRRCWPYTCCPTCCEYASMAASSCLAPNSKLISISSIWRSSEASSSVSRPACSAAATVCPTAFCASRAPWTQVAEAARCNAASSAAISPLLARSLARSATGETISTPATSASRRSKSGRSWYTNSRKMSPTSA